MSVPANASTDMLSLKSSGSECGSKRNWGANRSAYKPLGAPTPRDPQPDRLLTAAYFRLQDFCDPVEFLDRIVEVRTYPNELVAGIVESQ